IPLGAIIISGGVSISIFLTRYLISPLQQMANITLDIAKGDLTRTVNVQSQDEMGQLSVNFNKMTRALKKSYDDLKQEISERRRAEELLAFRVKIEALIAAVSTNFINLLSSEVDAGINRALKQIGEFSDVDRSYVFLYSDGGKRMDNTHEWCAKGIQPQKENLKGVFVEQFPWGIEKLKRFETIHVPRVNDLPDYASAERELQQSQSVQSCVVVPMIYGSSLVGLLGFDSVRGEKTWTNEDIGLLKIVAEIFVNALEHKRMEEVLRISEGKYRMLLENLPQRIFYKDENLRYVSCNENYARDLKIHADEIQGKTDYDFYPEVLAEKYRSDDKRIMRLKKTEEIEEKYINNGQELTVHTVKTPIRDEKGSVIGVLGIFWDITEKIALQTEAIRSRHLASVGELAAGVAHEINNPITGIINCAQILVNKSAKGTREEDIGHRIVKEGTRIADIVKSLLSFARPGDRKEQKVAVHVSEIISDTLVLMGSQLKKDNIELALHISHKLPKIRAHHQQIQQVFLNLISNARYALNSKYPESHENKILEIRGEAVTIDNCPCVKVTFHDKGTGIPADILDKVMNPFFSTKPRGKGTGLGLSISHSIVSDHGGKLLIDSVENEFTNVTVVLPLG
ncbi:MAG: PAS domain-containing protein, partial [Candidatus Brocadia sp.]